MKPVILTPEGKTLPPSDSTSIVLPVGSNITVFSTARISIKCRARGVPKPNIRWTVNGTEISATDKIFIGPNNLDLVNVATDDALEYTCTAENLFGKDTRSSTLSVLGKYTRATECTLRD